MTSEQIQAMIKASVDAAGGPDWWVYVAMVIGAGVAGFLGAYLGEKGKNLATKDDIATITQTVETVKRQHQEVIENLKAGHQLRMVAAERRLQAHQEAFTHCRELFNSMHSPEVNAVAGECLKWWESNCVYLGPESHQAFFDAFWAAAKHQSFLDARSPAKEIQENWAKITRAPNVILQEVSLPTLQVPLEEMGQKDENGPRP